MPAQCRRMPCRLQVPLTPAQGARVRLALREIAARYETPPPAGETIALALEQHAAGLAEQTRPPGLCDGCGLPTDAEQRQLAALERPATSTLWFCLRCGLNAWSAR